MDWSEEQNDDIRSSKSVNVLGIALVVEEVGEGANLIFRYPTNNHDETNNNLFWTLSSKGMEKLFRTKSSLCGQPMTLLINDTIFCCQSVFLSSTEDNQSAAAAAVKEEENDLNNNLIMFTVIVALHHPNSSSSSTTNTINGTKYSYFTHCIRNVHLSLSRLCRVLKREETRCSYMSRQASFLKFLLSTHQQQLQQQQLQQPHENQNDSVNITNSSTSLLQDFHPHSNNTNNDTHNKEQTPSSFVMRSFFVDSNTQQRGQKEKKIMENKQFTQQLVDYMLTATIPTNQDDQTIPIYGNLARELAQTYHALSRNSSSGDNDALLLPASYKLVTCRDGIVYINGHIAVPMESIQNISSSINSNGNHNLDSDNDDPCIHHYRRNKVRPYHTLLFPNDTLPKEFLDTSQNKKKHLQSQIVSMIHPCKSLQELANDLAIPLPIVLEYCSFLVSSSNDEDINKNICIVAPVIHPSSSRYVISPKTRAPLSFSLHFMQHFGIPMPLILSALTTPLPSQTSATNHENNSKTMKRNKMPITLQNVITLSCLYHEEGSNTIHHFHLENNEFQQDADDEEEEDDDDDQEDDKNTPTNDTIEIPESIVEMTDRLIWMYQQPMIKIPSGLIDSLVYTTNKIEENDHNNNYPKVPSSDSLTNYNDVVNSTSNKNVATTTASSSIYYPQQTTKNNTELDIPRTIENSIITMVVWLRSHDIIIELKDFITKFSDITHTTPSPSIFTRDGLQHQSSSGVNYTEEEGGNEVEPCEEEQLYQELLGGGFLVGNISIQAITWKLGISIQKISRFIKWGQRRKKIIVITRPALDTDDMGAP